jgi:transposase-like protein
MPLSQAEKERIYREKLNGQTLREIAEELDCSWETVRKWWKRWRNAGKAGIGEKRAGRGASGTLSQFDPRVAQKAESLKRQHPRWGANRVRIELSADPELAGAAIPRRSRLATFFKERCPECVMVYKATPLVRKAKPKATQVHEEWQMDSQEGIELGNGEMAIVSNLRDPVGAAPIASLAFSGKVTTRSRKLTFPEYRQVLRAGFSEFQTLPDRVSTDNELRFIGNPSSDFPGLLTLYLAGLGTQHVFIRPGRPTDHAEIERGHRTLDYLVFSEEDLQDLAHLQAALDRERQVYLHQFPCQASDCHGQPPLIAHPELLRPRRFYQLELEPLLFSMQRVFDFLATFTFERLVSHSGCVALTHQISIGRQYARTLPQRKIWVRCDPVSQEWVFYRKRDLDSDELVELVRRPITHLDFTTLTGLDPAAPLPAVPVQLPLPFLVSQ